MERVETPRLNSLPRELREMIWSYLTQPMDIYSALAVSKKYSKEITGAIEVIDGGGEVHMERLSKFPSLRIVKPLMVCDFKSLLGPYLENIDTCNIVFRASSVEKSSLLMSEYVKSHICRTPSNIRLMAQDNNMYRTIVITEKSIFSTSSKREVITVLECISELMNRKVHLPIPSPEVKRIHHEKGTFKGVLPPGTLMNKWVMVKSIYRGLSRPTLLRKSQSKDVESVKKSDLFTEGIMMYQDLLLSRVVGNITVPIRDMLLRDSVELSEALSIVPPSIQWDF